MTVRVFTALVTLAAAKPSLRRMQEQNLTELMAEGGFTVQNQSSEIMDLLSAGSGDAQTCMTGKATSYGLNWAAQGSSFFDDWTFMKEDEMHGAAQFVQKDQALAEGIISAGGTAHIGMGAVGAQFKRKTVNIHTNKAWDPNTGFLAVMKYSHVPWGAGVWPSFWAVNSDVLWPMGGELDIMEFANDEPSKVTFHTNKNCFLDMEKMSKCASVLGMNDGGGIKNCNTNYFQNLFGCFPKQKRFTGAALAGTPGVLAMEWTPEHIKIFLIPAGQIPPDLVANAPKPETWSKWVMAYFPFDSASCHDVAKPQELVISMGLCGDWAGGAWGNSPSAKQTGMVPGKGCKIDIWDPANDCCTKFVTSSAANDYLKSRAFFDLDYVKVFTPGGKGTVVSSSGTFRRGGVPLH